MKLGFEADRSDSARSDLIEEDFVPKFGENKV
jgi:hypothetical protein